MRFENLLNFTGRTRLPVIFQAERAECGVACVAMIAAFYGLPLGISDIRQRLGTSSRGASMETLVRQLSSLGFTGRALRLEHDELKYVRAPAILHWDMRHFVVLQSANDKYLVVHDPKVGRRRIPITEASAHFTGVVLEVTPAPDFSPGTEQTQRMKLTDLWAGLTGVKRLCAQIIAVSLALQIVTLLAPLFLQISVDGVLGSGDSSLLTVLAIGFCFLVVLNVSIEALRSFMVVYLGTHMNVHMITRLVHKLVGLPSDFFERRHVGDIISRFDSLKSIQRTLTFGFIESMVDGIVMLPLLIMMYVYSPTLATITLGIVCVYFGYRWFLYRPLREATEQQIIHEAKRQSYFLETLRGIQTIKLFNKESNRESRLQNLLIDTTNAGLRTERFRIAYKAGNTFLFGTENVAIVWIGIVAIMQGNFSIGMLFAFLMWKQMFSDKAVRLIERIMEFRMLRLHADRVADVALSESEENNDGLMKYSSADEPPSIVAENVGFRYGPEERYVLRDVSFEITSGECVAFSGASGCGKTTLLKIMTGLLQPTEGRLLINGHDLRHLPLDRYRDTIGAVMQDDVIFAGTIAENISFFDEAHDPADIERCARLAAVHDDIVRMPMAYRTLVGDMGSTLSGGQRQRILLARALYKNPAILFLDEATSHLDVAKESLVNNAIGKLNMTRVIAAHRPETLRLASRVICLERTSPSQRPSQRMTEGSL